MFNIPTSVTMDETNLLMGLSRDKIVYEAGSLLGYSTVALAQTAKKVFAVDPHDGYPRRAPVPTWNQFIGNIQRYNVVDRVAPIRSVFQNVTIPELVQLAFADLTGQKRITEQFLEMTHHIPLVAIHDYERVGCEGATEAIDTYIQIYRPKVHRVHTLIVLEK